MRQSFEHLCGKDTDGKKLKKKKKVGEEDPEHLTKFYSNKLTYERQTKTNLEHIVGLRYDMN